MMMTAQQTMTTSEGQLTNMGSDGKGQAVTSGDNQDTSNVVSYSVYKVYFQKFVFICS